jgi:choline dehydrogenase
LTARYDTVIVGAGTAGAILAARLSEDPSRSVCVIEAGQDYATIDDLPLGVLTHRSLRGLAVSVTRQANDPELLGFPDWGFTARSTDLQPSVPLPRGKVVGGSSSINGAVFFHALREDLDAWAAAGNPGWGFDDCQPFFKRVEADADFPNEHHGTSGPIPVHRAHAADLVPLSLAFYRACIALGFPDCPDFNRPDSWGVGPLPVNVHDRVRYSSAVGYLMPARARRNLTVVARTTAHGLTFDRKRVTGVRVVGAAGASTIEAGEVILAAGAAVSPQLLMLSGIGPAEHLTSVGVAPVLDLPGVGRHLLDHPVGSASWRASEVTLPESGPGMPGQLGLRATTPSSDDPWDMRLASFSTAGAQQFGLAFSLMHASSEGRLCLAAADPRVPPRIDMRHLDHPSDLERMRSMLRFVLQLVDHTAYDGLRLQRISPSEAEVETDAALDGWLLSTLYTGHHISGTCKMGPAGDPLAVVDADCRLHGIDGLRVIDASIMPDCPRVNINATTMMLAEKMSAELAG